MNDQDPTVTVLTDAMRGGTATITASPDLAARVVRRRARRDRIRYAGTALGVVAVLAGTAVAVGQVGVNRPSPVTPAASGSASASPSLSAAEGRHSLFEVTVLPAGYTFFHGGTDELRLANDAMGRAERVSYRRGNRAQITLETISGNSRAMNAGDYKDSPGAEVVTIGTRQVFHQPNTAGSGGLNIYQWTEEVGLDVIVDGRSGATDAELRQFILGIRRRA